MNLQRRYSPLAFHDHAVDPVPTGQDILDHLRSCRCGTFKVDHDGRCNGWTHCGADCCGRCPHCGR